MDRLINILIILAAVVFIIGIGVGYEFIVAVFSAKAFNNFAMVCLTFAITLILMQIRDKQ